MNATLSHIRSRRHFLTTLPTAGLLAAGGVSTRAGGSTLSPSLRAAHITDVHITADHMAPAGVAAMFTHMTQGGWKPDVILNTGDTVMAIDGQPGRVAEELIRLWESALKGAPAPMLACLGNHDVWDGEAPTERIPASKKRFALMTEVNRMPAPYYSVDRGGWHLIALNSVDEWPNYGALSPTQFDWLRSDLQRTPPSTPVCILSHLPIISVTSSLFGKGQKRPDGVLIPRHWQHVDCWELSEVFRRHPNVKVCLSGHMHTWDRVEYRGVWYLCGGAACGSWWKGSEYGFPPCYGRLDLFPNGTFDYQFIDYGWPAREWKGDQLAG